MGFIEAAAILEGEFYQVYELDTFIPIGKMIKSKEDGSMFTIVIDLARYKMAKDIEDKNITN